MEAYFRFFECPLLALLVHLVSIPVVSVSVRWRPFSVYGLPVDRDSPGTVHGQSKDNPRTVHGQLMDCPWTVPGQSMDCPWTVRGQSMDCPWTVHGLFMDCP